MKKARFEIYGLGIDKPKYGWMLYAANGSVIAQSASHYVRKRDARRALNTVYMAIFEAGEKL